MFPAPGLTPGASGRPPIACRLESHSASLTTLQVEAEPGSDVTARDRMCVCYHPSSYSDSLASP
jgi:hypothetical protein